MQRRRVGYIGKGEQGGGVACRPMHRVAGHRRRLVVIKSRPVWVRLHRRRAVMKRGRAMMLGDRAPLRRVVVQNPRKRRRASAHGPYRVGLFMLYLPPSRCAQRRNVVWSARGARAWPSDRSAGRRVSVVRLAAGAAGRVPPPAMRWYILTPPLL